MILYLDTSLLPAVPPKIQSSNFLNESEIEVKGTGPRKGYKLELHLSCTKQLQIVLATSHRNFYPMPQNTITCLKIFEFFSLGFPGGSAGKEFACDVGDRGLEDSLEKGKVTHSNILAWRIPRTAHGFAKSNMTERLFFSLVKS